jgi:hypothetical protein
MGCGKDAQTAMQHRNDDQYAIGLAIARAQAMIRGAARNGTVIPGRAKREPGIHTPCLAMMARR